MNDIEQHLQKLREIAMEVRLYGGDVGLSIQIENIVDDIENNLDDAYLQQKADAARDEWSRGE